MCTMLAEDDVCAAADAAAASDAAANNAPVTRRVLRMLRMTG
jgi:hypothetical protein